MKPDRIERSTENRVITVGLDVPDVQTAMYEIPFYLEHYYVISIPDGIYDEDVIIPSFYFDAGDMINGRIPSLTIIGNSQDPDSVEISSLWIAGGKTNRILIDGMKFVCDGPYGDAGASLELREGASAVLHSVKFDSGDDAARAICNYGGNLFIKGPVDLGVNYVNGIVNKNMGHVNVSCKKGPLTGTCKNSVFWNQRGSFSYARENNEATADLISRCSSDPIHSYLSSEDNSIIIKGLK